MALARFLQLSDLHLGRPFAWLPSERREMRRRDQQAALEQAGRLAIERGVHAILVPGDLFDGVPGDPRAPAFPTPPVSLGRFPPPLIPPPHHPPAPPPH